MTFYWQQESLPESPGSSSCRRGPPELPCLEAGRALARMPGPVRGSRCWPPSLAVCMNDCVMWRLSYRPSSPLTSIWSPSTHNPLPIEFSSLSPLFLAIAAALAITLISFHLDFYDGASASLCLYFPSLDHILLTGSVLTFLGQGSGLRALIAIYCFSPATSCLACPVSSFIADCCSLVLCACLPEMFISLNPTH